MLYDHKIVSSVVFLLVVLALRWAVIYVLKKRAEDEEGQIKRWINSCKNITILVMFLGMLIIWLSELRFVALSIAAFAVAIVLITKEFIQCLLGYVFIATTSPFRLGDWISTGSLAGEVVSNDWLSTRLLEVETDEKSYAYTGKTIFIPNSQFVTTTLKNLNHMRRYVEHSFSVVCKPDIVDIHQTSAFILEQAQQVIGDFKDVAKRYNNVIEKRMGINPQGTESKVRVSTSELGNLVFTISVFCPTQQAVNIEQRLTKTIISYLYLEKCISEPC